jgi:hypothetical protein
LVKDLQEVRGDLIGKKLMELLRGAEGTHEEEGETVNVFDLRAATSETASLEPTASQLQSAALRLRAESEDSSVIAPVDSHMEGDEPLLAIADASQLDSNLQTSENTSVTEDSSTVVTVSVDERNLSEYEAKLHRYSSKVRMEITERLRKPEGSCYFVFVREGKMYSRLKVECVALSIVVICNYCAPFGRSCGRQNHPNLSHFAHVR